MGNPAGVELAGLFFAGMDASSHISSWLLRTGIVLAVAVGTLLLDGAAVMLLWMYGVDFAVLDMYPPGESGLQIKPMSADYKWLLAALLTANSGMLWYLLTRRRELAWAFAAGAVVPMAYAVNILFSA